AALSCSYRYRFDPGPSSGQFETDLAQLEASGFAERKSPVNVSERGQAWLAEESRAAGVEQLRAIAREILPGYLAAGDLVRDSIRKSQEAGARALATDRVRAQEIIAKLPS